MKYLSIELSEVAVRFVSVDEHVTSHHDFLFTDTKDNRYKEQLLDLIKINRIPLMILLKVEAIEFINFLLKKNCSFFGK